MQKEVKICLSEVNVYSTSFTLSVSQIYCVVKTWNKTTFSKTAQTGQ
jgi:hypothetical protein